MARDTVCIRCDCEDLEAALSVLPQLDRDQEGT